VPGPPAASIGERADVPAVTSVSRSAPAEHRTYLDYTV
jgi:hypothetical protein